MSGAFSRILLARWLVSPVLAICVLACGTSSTTQRIPVTDGCKKEIQSLRKGWKQNAKTGLYSIDTARLPGPEALKWCYSPINPRQFVEIFGEPDTSVKFPKIRRLRYAIESEQRYVSQMEVQFLKDTIQQFRFYDCNSLEDRIKSNFEFDKKAKHFVSRFKPLVKIKEVGVCLSGVDSSTVLALLGQPSSKELAARKFHYFTRRPWKPGLDPIQLPRIEVLFNKNWEVTSISEELAVKYSH